MSDQLRLDAEEQSLREQAASLDDGLRLQRQQFNIVMHREADAPLVIPDTITLREMPTYAWTDIETADPVLQKSIADGKAFDAQERLADKMGKPTFSVGLQYMLNGKVKRPVMENMNGMDMIMPMVTVSLPIYRRKKRQNSTSSAPMRLTAAARTPSRANTSASSNVLLTPGARWNCMTRRWKYSTTRFN